jgi:membrane protein YqaA with SNARE-associated domain
VEWVGLTLGYSLVSALIPVFNIEVYLVGLVSQQPQLQWWLLGLAAAVGQLTGKTLFYLAGRGSLRLPDWLHRRASYRGSGRWSRWLQRLHDRFHRTARRRPVWTIVVLLASASVGLPPFGATALIAGLAEVPLPVFLTAGLIGRFARFGAIAASPGLLAAWWF